MTVLPGKSNRDITYPIGTANQIDSKLVTQHEIKLSLIEYRISGLPSASQMRHGVVNDASAASIARIKNRYNAPISANPAMNTRSDARDVKIGLEDAGALMEISPVATGPERWGRADST